MSGRVHPMEDIVKKCRINKFDIWALGITVVIGGQYFSWNYGLSAGFGSYLIATVLMGTSYLCLCLCVSEISSALPFAGGAYGLARCTLGFYLGYLIGCFETFEYIIYVAVSTVLLGEMFSSFIPDVYQPLIWLAFFGTALFIHINGGHLFWKSNFFFAIVSITILLIYSFGSFHYAHLNVNAAENNGTWFRGGMFEFVKVFPISAWFFVGVEALNFACNDIDNPRVNIPFGQISCIITLNITAILVIFAANSLPPGIDSLKSDLNPLNTGFIKMFSLSQAHATLLSFPATYATAFGFIYAYGKLMHALASSSILPEAIRHVNRNGSPYAAIILGSLLSYLICLLLYYVPFISRQAFNICILSGFMAYMSQSYGYIYLKLKFSHIERKFQSPLGIYGAMYTFLVSLLGVISIICCQDDNQFAFIVIVCATAILSLIYFLFIQQHQSFSEEEKQRLFFIHVDNCTYLSCPVTRTCAGPTDRRSIDLVFGLFLVVHLPTFIRRIHILRPNSTPTHGICTRSR